MRLGKGKRPGMGVGTVLVAVAVAMLAGVRVDLTVEDHLVERMAERVEVEWKAAVVGVERTEHTVAGRVRMEMKVVERVRIERTMAVAVPVRVEMEQTVRVPPLVRHWQWSDNGADSENEDKTDGGWSGVNDVYSHFAIVGLLFFRCAV